MFLAVVGGLSFLFILAANLEASHEYFVEQDPTSVVQLEEGLEGVADKLRQSFIGNDPPAFQADFSFDSFLESIGGQRTSFGTEGFIPNDPNLDTTVRIISGTEGFVPDITTFGTEDFVPDITTFGTEDFIPGTTGGLSDFGTPGFNPAGGALSDAVNGVFKDLGLGGIANAIPGGILGGIGSVLPGGLGGLLGGGGGGNFVPVKDFTQIALQQQQVTKEYSLDPVAYLAARTTIRGVLSGVLNWINTGDNGNPYYVTNSIDHFRNVDSNTINVFLTEIQRIGLSGNIQRSLALSASVPFARTIQPTLSPVQQSAFLQNFNNGGWQTWLYMLQPQNNPLGQYRLAAEELERRRAEAELREAQELAWGSGFKPATVCVAKDFAGNCTHREIVTPGTFIEGQMAGVFSSVIRQLEADDELQEITSRLLSGMISQILGGRTTGLRGFSSAELVSPRSDSGIARTRSGLLDAINILFLDETNYITIKSRSLTRLDEAKTSLEALLPPRVYNFSEPLKSRVTSSQELTAAVSGNQTHATTTINTKIIPTQQTLANEIVSSRQIINKIESLAQELQNTNTADGFLLISDKFIALQRTVHSKSDGQKAEEEFNSHNDFAGTTISDASSRLNGEQAIIDKIRNELFPQSSN